MLYNRRDFIWLSSLGLVGLRLFPVASFFSARKEKVNNIAEMLKIAATHRKNKNYHVALLIYNEVINIQSDEIRAYDGIRKVYLQSKYRELDVLQLYIDGEIKNPNNAIFKERIAKEYTRLSLGNKKFSNTLGGNLLDQAKIIFDDIVTANTENVQFVAQRQKIYRKISQRADTVDARENQVLKISKKDNKAIYKTRFEDRNIAYLEDKLSVMLEANFSVDRKKHIGEMYVTLLRKYHKNGDKINLSNKIIEYYNYNDDQNSMYLIRNLCRRNKLPIIENIEKLNNTKKNTFWSHVALIGALIKFNKTSEAQTYLSASKTKSMYYHHEFEIKDREIKNAIQKNDLTIAKNLILNLGEYIVGTSSAHYIDRYNLLCVKYFSKKGQSSESLKVLNIALGIDNKNYEDSVLKKVTQINIFREDEKLVHKERLNAFKQLME